MLRQPLSRAGAVLVATAALAAAACSDVADPGPCAALDDDGCAAVTALRLPASLPPSPGNAHADDPAAAELGITIFFAPGFARTGDVRCVTCHQPELAFRDRGPVSIGVGRGARNAPTILDAARLPVLMWDGRADSLWSQPLLAFEHPLEMDFTRLEVAHRIGGDPDLRTRYQAVFGPLPDLSVLPARGKPGDPTWDTLPAAQQHAVNLVAANVGKALEAYMRRAAAGDAPLDAYLDGDDQAVPTIAQRGLATFVTAGCSGCHGGPMLTDGRFHAGQLPSLPDAVADAGRADGARVVAASVFNAAGPFADQPGPAPVRDDAAIGGFRTPSLRHVMKTAPYGHDGAVPSLDALFDVHAPALTADERMALTALFLQLEGARPPRPWNDWPRPQ